MPKSERLVLYLEPEIYDFIKQECIRINPVNPIPMTQYVMDSSGIYDKYIKSKQKQSEPSVQPKTKIQF